MTCGIIFLGTPHEGSPHPSRVEVTQKLYAWATWSPAIATNLTRELETYSNTTIDINRNFMRKISQTIELVGFYETKPMRIPSFQGADLVSPLLLLM